jgi:DNA-binding NarL/FixJ family response regulator
MPPASVPPPVRVIVIEDIRDVREGLGVLINGTRGFAFAGGFDTMENALRDMGRVAPDIVLTDLGLRERYPEMPILALSVYDEDDAIFDALCAGASGYLLKNTAPARILEALTEAMNGGAPMSPEVARRVVRLFREFRPPERASYRLTAQESELLKLFVEGHHYKTAADVMNISVNTVGFHLKNIYAKLRVHSKTEAVAKALRERLV